MRRWIATGLMTLLLAAALPPWAMAVNFDFRAPASAGDAAAAAAMRDLAARLIPVYQETDPDRYLANLSALQLVVGDYAAADTSRRALRNRRRSGRPLGREVIFDMYARAKAAEAGGRTSFADSFANSYKDELAQFSDEDAYAVTKWLATPAAVYRDALQKALDQQRAVDSIGEAQAVDLLWAYLSFDAYRSFGPLVGALNTEEDRRRYTFENDIVIEAPNGVKISAIKRAFALTHRRRPMMRA